MQASASRLIYFSPTGTTERVLGAVAQGLAAPALPAVNLTAAAAAAGDFPVLGDEALIIGVPVYSGRVPPEAARRLQRLAAPGSPAVLVVLYGNRAFEDALVELRDLVVGLGCRPVAAGAFIGEHSFSSPLTPLAGGRPDAEDLARARELGAEARRKLAGLGSPAEAPELAVPGNRPYRQPWEAPRTSPVTDEALCVQCGTCVAVCPTGAVSLDEAVRTEVESCILCCACVKNCPTGARQVRDATLLKAAQWLSDNFSEPKKPELFL